MRHLRLVLGNSMGGMRTWIWAQEYPDFMDVAVRMASLPTEMSGRNWMTRRLIIDSIRNDPEWMNGNYTTQPRSLQTAGHGTTFQARFWTQDLAELLHAATRRAK